jgi:hypothetical protein
MFTSETLIKDKIDLYNITVNHTYEDYYINNNKVSYNTKIAYRYYTTICDKNPEDITLKEEEEIKTFLLLYKTYRKKYLQDVGGKAYFTKVLQNENISGQYNLSIGGI